MPVQIPTSYSNSENRSLHCGSFPEESDIVSSDLNALCSVWTVHRLPSRLGRSKSTVPSTAKKPSCVVPSTFPFSFNVFDQLTIDLASPSDCYCSRTRRICLPCASSSTIYWPVAGVVQDLAGLLIGRSSAPLFVILLRLPFSTTSFARYTTLCWALRPLAITWGQAVMIQYNIRGTIVFPSAMFGLGLVRYRQ